MDWTVFGLVAAAALFWAISSQIEPDALMDGFGAISFRAARAVVSVVVMAVVIGIVASSTASKEKPSKEIAFGPSSSAVVLTVVGATLGTLAGVAYYYALERNNGHATTIVAISTPLTLIFTAIIGACFFPNREALTKVQWVGVVLAIFAVGMISWSPKMAPSEEP